MKKEKLKQNSKLLLGKKTIVTLTDNHLKNINGGINFRQISQDNLNTGCTGHPPPTVGTM